VINCASILSKQKFVVAATISWFSKNNTVSAKFNESAKIPGDDWAKMCCISKKFDESAKTSWFSKKYGVLAKTCCVSKNHHKVNAQIMTRQMSTSLYFLTSNQRLYSHDITHSMTLSVTLFHDALWAIFSVTLSVTVFFPVTHRACRFPWRFSMTLCRSCILLRFPSRFFSVTLGGSRFPWRFPWRFSVTTQCCDFAEW